MSSSTSDSNDSMLPVAVRSNRTCQGADEFSATLPSEVSLEFERRNSVRWPSIRTAYSVENSSRDSVGLVRFPEGSESSARLMARPSPRAENRPASTTSDVDLQPIWPTRQAATRRDQAGRLRIELHHLHRRVPDDDGFGIVRVQRARIREPRPRKEIALPEHLVMGLER